MDKEIPGSTFYIKIIGNPLFPFCIREGHGLKKQLIEEGEIIIIGDFFPKCYVTGCRLCSRQTGSRLSTFFLKNNGTCWASGNNKKGFLGIGSIETAVGTSRQVKIDNVIAVAPSGNHTLFLKNDGKLWECGINCFGQLGTALEPNTLSTVPIKIVESGVVAVSAGLENNFYIMGDGSLWPWVLLALRFIMTRLSWV